MAGCARVSIFFIVTTIVEFLSMKATGGASSTSSSSSSAGTLPIDGWVLSASGYTNEMQIKSGDAYKSKGNVVTPTFEPPFVDFEQCTLCKARKATVVITNHDPKQSLRLHGIVSGKDDVHCTWFDTDEVPPGKNTSFIVVHLGRSLGKLEASLTLSTSFGDLTYQVYANSILNPLRAKPLTNGRIPVGATYVETVSLFNPLDGPLSVVEMYTSTDLLQLEPTEPLGPHGFGSKESWAIRSMETKAVMRLTTTATVAGVIKGFVHIRTNVSDADVMIPVRIDVLEVAGLYHGPGDSIDFGALSVSESPRSRDIVILSNTEQVLRILKASVVSCINLLDEEDTHCPSISVRLKRLSGLTEPNQFTAVGETTLALPPSRRSGLYSGFISIDYSNLEEHLFQLHVPFYVHVLSGSLVFPNADDVLFHIGQSHKKVQTKSITVRNEFEHNVALTSIVIPPELSKTLRVDDFEPMIIVPNGSATFPLSFVAESDDHITATVELMTNTSSHPYLLPVCAYSGLLQVETGDEYSSELDFGQINLGEEYSKRLELLNSNPVPVKVGYTRFRTSATTPTLPSVEFVEVVDGDSVGATDHCRESSKEAPDPDYLEGSVTHQILLKPGQKAVFKVTVEPSSKGRLNTELQIGTSYGVQDTPVRYKAFKHSLSIRPRELAFGPTFPGQFHDPTRRKASGIRHLVPLERKSIMMRPRDRLADITNVYSDDPRLIIDRFEDHDDTDGSTQVRLASVAFDAAMGTWSDNYAPQIQGMGTNDGVIDLTSDVVAEVQRAQSAWRRLVRNKRTKVSAKVFVESTSSKTDTIDVTATLAPLQLDVPPGVNFPLTQIRHVAHESLTVTNPSQFPVHLRIAPLSAFAGDTAVLSGLAELFDLLPGDADPAEAGTTSVNASFDAEGTTETTISPYGEATLSVEFRPQAAGPLSATLLLQNNLTAVQHIQVTGEAGRGTFGFPRSQPYIVDGGLVFTITSSNLSYCRLSRRMSPEDGKRRFEFNVTVVNRGNMGVRVEALGIDNASTCSAFGLTVNDCKPFTLRPKRPKTFPIYFVPDFRTTQIQKKLVVRLEGLDRTLNFNVAVTLPKQAVKACFDSLPGPDWEGKFKGSVVVALLTVGALIFAQEYALGTWHSGYRRKPAKASKAEKLKETHSGGDVPQVTKNLHQKEQAIIEKKEEVLLKTEPSDQTTCEESKIQQQKQQQKQQRQQQQRQQQLQKPKNVQVEQPLDESKQQQQQQQSSLPKQKQKIASQKQAGEKDEVEQLHKVNSEAKKQERSSNRSEDEVSIVKDASDDNSPPAGVTDMAQSSVVSNTAVSGSKVPKEMKHKPKLETSSVKARSGGTFVGQKSGSNTEKASPSATRDMPKTRMPDIADSTATSAKSKIPTTSGDSVAREKRHVAKREQMPQVEKPETPIAETQARALQSQAGKSSPIVARNVMSNAHSVQPPLGVSQTAFTTESTDLSPNLQTHSSSGTSSWPSPGRSQPVSHDTPHSSGSNGNNPSLYKQWDSREQVNGIRNTAGPAPGLLDTPFESSLDGSDWLNMNAYRGNGIPDGNGGSSGPPFLSGNHLQSRQSAPIPPLMRGSNMRRPPGLSSPVGIAAGRSDVTGLGNLGTAPGGLPPLGVSEMSDFNRDGSLPWESAANGGFISGQSNDALAPGYSPNTSPQMQNGVSNVTALNPPPGLSWSTPFSEDHHSSTFGSDSNKIPFNPPSEPGPPGSGRTLYNSQSEPGYLNLPTIPHVAEKNIWGMSGGFGDLDWAKPDSKKMNADATDWTPGSGW